MVGAIKPVGAMNIGQQYADAQSAKQKAKNAWAASTDYNPYTSTRPENELDFGSGSSFQGYFTNRNIDSSTGGSSFEFSGSEAENQRQRIEQQYNKQRAFTDAAFSQGRNYLRMQLDSVMKGYSDAESSLQRSGRSQRQTALDRETALAGDLAANTGGRGYLKDYYSRSLSADTTRQLMAVDEQLANKFAGLYVNRGQAEGQAMAKVGTTYLDQAGTYQSLLAQQNNALAGHNTAQYQKDNSGFYSLLGSAAQAAGAYFGAGG